MWMLSVDGRVGPWWRVEHVGSLAECAAVAEEIEGAPLDFRPVGGTLPLRAGGMHALYYIYADAEAGGVSGRMRTPYTG